MCSLLLNAFTRVEGWGVVLIGCLRWQDVVTSLACVNHTFHHHLKTTYPLKCGGAWAAATQCGWQVVLQAFCSPTHKLPLPTLHLQELEWHRAIQTLRPADRQDSVLVCPALRQLTLHPTVAVASARWKAIKTIVHNHEAITEAEWHEVARRSHWILATPRLERLTIAKSSTLERQVLASGRAAFVMSVLYAMCFKTDPADGACLPAPLLQHLDLAFPLQNDAAAVSIMKHLSLSLRSLSTLLMHDWPDRVWSWQVCEWPELRELTLGWDTRRQPVCTGMPVFRRLHAPHLHTLDIAVWSVGGVGELSQATRESLRNLTLRVVENTSLRVDLGWLPGTLVKLRCLAPEQRATLRVDLISLPTGLQEFELSGVWWTLILGTGSVTLPGLKRLHAPLAFVDLVDAPQLHEVVLDGSATEPLSAVGRERLGRVRHVTSRLQFNPIIAQRIRPWVTRIELLSCVTDNQSWADCPRLRTLHLPNPTSEHNLESMRSWATANKKAFTVTQCHWSDN